MLIAPTEPAALKAIGSVSSLPEKFGADALFASHGEWVGIQRKELHDFIASVQDGRMAREVAMLKRVNVAVLVIEGSPTWTMDGALMGKGFGTQWTLAQHRGYLWSVRAKGVWVDYTDDVQGTVSWIEMFRRWCDKAKHVGLDRRPGPINLWGKPENVDYACHILMGIPGVGPELARRLVDKFGMPLEWRIDMAELVEVEGIGPKKARQMWEAIEMNRVEITRVSQKTSTG